MRPRQDVQHFVNAILKRIFFNENCCILILMNVFQWVIDNIPLLIQIMAWHRPAYKTLSEPMMTRVCVTQPQWVNRSLNQLVTCINVPWLQINDRLYMLNPIAPSGDAFFFTLHWTHVTHWGWQKSPPFCRRCFQFRFLNEKCCQWNCHKVKLTIYQHWFSS